MSSTNRGGKRSVADYYPTPSWCVLRLLERLELPQGRWLEPCAGDGAIIAAVAESGHGDAIEWFACEIRSECRRSLGRLLPKENIRIGDFACLDEDWPKKRISVAITNPPFSQAMGFIEACRERAEFTVVLERLGFLASEKRADFMRHNPPDVYVIPNRADFSGGGGDSSDYAWLVWGPRKSRRRGGRIEILDSTPREVRMEARSLRKR